MLAQNFKTPADLDLDDAEFDGLVKTLGLLEREEVEHFPAKKGCFSAREKPTGFNMLLVRTKTECGTAACILGWARELSGQTELFRGRERQPALNDLFCMAPRNSLFRGKNSEDILPAEAAAALRNFLTHGDPRWSEVFNPL